MKTNQVIAFMAAILISVSGCNKSDVPDLSNTKAPEIKSIMEELAPDLNKADNIPLVCVVYAEAGLKSVEMKIVKGGIETDYKTVSEFYDNKQYSVKELPLWDDTFQSFKIIATDLAGRKVEQIIPITVIKYLAAPVITFPQAEILIDENTGQIIIPRTTFQVTGASQLTKVEVSLFTASGIKPIPLNPAFIPGLTYSFDQDIPYMAGDNALQVSATDAYGKIKIETLPIKYISIPPPVLVPTGTTTLDPIIAANGSSRTLTFSATSASGINAIRIYRLEKDVVTELTALSQTYTTPQETVSFSAALPAFTATTTGFRLTAFDRLGRSTQVDVKALIDIDYNPMARIGSQFYSKVADAAYPDIYNFYSVKDKKTYSLSQFYNNRPNIDMYFYFFGGAVRLYSATINRPGEAWSGDLANGIPLMENWTGVARNNTKIKKFTPGAWGFNFDNVTATDLKSAAVQSYVNSAQVTADFANYVAGESAFFQTSSSSTSGVKTGIMKIESFTVDPTNNTKGFYIVSFKVAQ